MRHFFVREPSQLSHTIRACPARATRKLLFDKWCAGRVLKVQENDSILLFYSMVQYDTSCAHNFQPDAETTYHLGAVQVAANTLVEDCWRPCRDRGYSLCHSVNWTRRPTTRRVSINVVNTLRPALIDRRLGRNPGSDPTSSTRSARESSSKSPPLM